MFIRTLAAPLICVYEHKLGNFSVHFSLSIWVRNDRIYNVILYHLLSTDDTCKLTCENGGKCVINEKGDPRCYCWPSYSGERCETNHCNNYCQNGGTCAASVLGKYFNTLLSETLIFYQHVVEYADCEVIILIIVI